MRYLCIIALLTLTACAAEREFALPAAGPLKIQEGFAIRKIYGDPIMHGKTEYVMVPYSIRINPTDLKSVPEEHRHNAMYYQSGQTYTNLTPAQVYTPVNVKQGKAFFAVDAEGERGEAKDLRNAFIGMASHNAYRDGLNNLIIVHKTTNKTQLLLDRRAVITYLAYIHVRDDEAQKIAPPKYLLVNLRDTDTNKNGFIDQKDAVSAYAANLDGSNMIQLTPAGTMYDDLIVDHLGKIMYFRVIYDSNKNGKFTDPLDEQRLLKIDMAKPAMGSPLISDEVRDKVLKIITE